MKRCGTCKNKQEGRKYAVMFGYRGRTDENTVGYLRISDSGYEIVPDQDGATRFGYSNAERKRGWASPDKWLKFFNTESELSPWVFHIVKVTKPEHV